MIDSASQSNRQLSRVTFTCPIRKRHGPRRFTKSLAKNVLKRGIRVNAVAPGPVWTPLVVASFHEEKNAQFGKGYPMERPAQPAELAPSYVFLASDESRYVVGEVLGVTGGKPLG